MKKQLRLPIEFKIIAIFYFILSLLFFAGVIYLIIDLQRPCLGDICESLRSFALYVFILLFISFGVCGFGLFKAKKWSLWSIFLMLMICFEAFMAFSILIKILCSIITLVIIILLIRNRRILKE